MKMSRLLVIALLQLVTTHVSNANPSYSYNARIQCGNSSTTNNEYFSAANHMEANNEVMRIIKEYLL